MRTAFLALFVLATLPAAANTRDCGDNAFTFAEVVEAQGGTRAKGPIISVPDSLCADIIEHRKSGLGSLNLQVGDPYGTAGSARRRGAGGSGGAPVPGPR